MYLSIDAAASVGSVTQTAGGGSAEYHADADLLDTTEWFQAVNLDTCAVGPVTEWRYPPFFGLGEAPFQLENTTPEIAWDAGLTVADAGDQDGVPGHEVLIGAPSMWFLGGDDRRGAVFVVTPQPYTSIDACRLVGEDLLTHAGFDLDGGMDVSGDGLPDVVVATALDRVDLFHGPVCPGVVDLPTADLTIESNDADHAQLLPDLTGDGNAELLVGWNDGLTLIDGNLTGQFDGEAVADVIIGEIRGNGVVAEDFDGDGVNDLFGTGDVFLYVNQYAMVFNGPLTGVLAAADADVQVPTRVDFPALESGDFDGDGRPDLVSASGWAIDGVIEPKTLIFPGTTVGMVDESASFAQVVLPPPNTFGVNGDSVVDDFDGDGQADLVMGVPIYVPLYPQSRMGLVALFYGPLKGEILLEEADVQWVSGVNGLQVGSTLDSVPDQDGDGVRDLLAGLPGYGAVIFSGAP